MAMDEHAATRFVSLNYYLPGTCELKNLILTQPKGGGQRNYLCVDNLLDTTKFYLEKYGANCQALCSDKGGALMLGAKISSMSENFKNCVSGLQVNLLAKVANGDELVYKKNECSTRYKIDEETKATLQSAGIHNKRGLTDTTFYENFSSYIQKIKEGTTNIDAKCTLFWREMDWLRVCVIEKRQIVGHDRKRLGYFILFLSYWSDKTGMIKQLRTNLEFYYNLSAGCIVFFCYMSVYFTEKLIKFHCKKGIQDTRFRLQAFSHPSLDLPLLLLRYSRNRWSMYCYCTFDAICCTHKHWYQCEICEAVLKNRECLRIHFKLHSETKISFEDGFYDFVQIKNANLQLPNQFGVKRLIVSTIFKTKVQNFRNEKTSISIIKFEKISYFGF